MKEYQEKAMSTNLYSRDERGTMAIALALCEEAGEVAGKISKNIRDSEGVMSEELRLSVALELGDVLWQATALAERFGFTLEGVALLNIKKLASRKRRGVLNGSGDER